MHLTYQFQVDILFSLQTSLLCQTDNVARLAGFRFTFIWNSKNQV